MLRTLSLLKKLWQTRRGTLEFPYKMNYIVTKECHSRCVNCRIWESKPHNELRLDEIEKIAAANPYLSWINFTGGEPTDRPDFVAAVTAFARNCPDLSIVHFPTNGLKPERIAEVARALAQLGIPRLFVTVSIDGPPAENDRLRGIPGDFDSAIRTYRLLEEIRGVKAFVGMTLYATNHKLVDQTFAAIKKEIPRFGYGRFHINLAHLSEHYYENGVIKKTVAKEMIESLRKYRRRRGIPLTPVDWMENRFHRLSEDYILTGKTPVDCAALVASCFLTEMGELYPCAIWGQSLGNVRNTEYRFADLLRSDRTQDLKAQIKAKACANCWTPCEGFQSIAMTAGRVGRT